MARLHAGEVEDGMQLLGRAQEEIEGIEDKSDSLAVAQNLYEVLSDVDDVDGVSAFRKQLSGLIESVRDEDDPTLGLTANIKDSNALAQFLGTLGSSLYKAGDKAQALTILQKALTIASSLEGSQRLIVLSDIASMQLSVGLEDQGAQVFHELIADVARIEDEKKRVEQYIILEGCLARFVGSKTAQGVIEKVATELRQSRSHDDPSLMLVENVDDFGSRVQVLSGLAVSLFDAGNAERSAVTLAKTLEIVSQIEDSRILAPSLAHLAVAQAKTGKLPEAKQTLEQIEKVLNALDGDDNKLAALMSVLAAMREARDEEQNRWILSQLIQLSGLIQSNAVEAMRQAFALVDRMEEGREKALAMKQVAAGLEPIQTKGSVGELHFNLARLYHQGKYLEKSSAHAARFYKKAAREGNAAAQVALGLMHLQGEVSDPDIKQAVIWLQSAADQGDADGQVSLGMLHALGKGIKQDLVAAHKWVSLAAAQDHAGAKTALIELEGKITAEQLEQSAELAQSWKASRQPVASDPKKEKEDGEKK